MPPAPALAKCPANAYALALVLSSDKLRAMDGQLIGLDATAAMERVALLLGGLDPAGQRALAKDLGHWLERWQDWITATGSWDSTRC